MVRLNAILWPLTDYFVFHVSSKYFGEGNAPHSSILAWKIPWMEEPARLRSMGSLRVGHDWATSLSLSHTGEGNGNPLQCSCLEGPRDGGARWAAVYAITQTQTRLRWPSSSSSSKHLIISCIVSCCCWELLVPELCGRCHGYVCASLVKATWFSLTFFSMLHLPNFVLRMPKYCFIFGMLHNFQDLSSLTGVELMPSEVKVGSPNHWTTREFPILFLNSSISFLLLFCLNLWSREGTAEARSPFAAASFLPQRLLLWQLEIQYSSESSFSILGRNILAPPAPSWSCFAVLPVTWGGTPSPPRLQQSRAVAILPLRWPGSGSRLPRPRVPGSPRFTWQPQQVPFVGAEHTTTHQLSPELESTYRNQFLRSPQRQDIIPSLVEVKDRSTVKKLGGRVKPQEGVPRERKSQLGTMRTLISRAVQQGKACWRKQWDPRVWRRANGG